MSLLLQQQQERLVGDKQKLSSSISPNPLTKCFTSSSPIVRSGLFHSLLSKVWREKGDEVGRGEVVWEKVSEVAGVSGVGEEETEKNLPHALLSSLLTILYSPLAHDKAQLVFFLSLLCEATNNPTFLPLLVPSLSLLLSLLKEAHQQKDHALVRSLVYLLGHFEEETLEKISILAEVSNVLGEQSPHTLFLAKLKNVGGGGKREETQEEEEKEGGGAKLGPKDVRESFLSFFGAEVWRETRGGGNLLERAKKELCCPSCISSSSLDVSSFEDESSFGSGSDSDSSFSSSSPSFPLSFEEEEVVCLHCGESFGFLFDLPVLVSSSERSPDLYVKQVADEYDDEKRPPFVALMSGLTNLTLSIEQNYLLNHLEPLPSSPLLDLACGTGLLTQTLSLLSPSHRLLCVDFSPHMLNACRNRIKNGGLFVVGSAGRLPVQSGVLGGACCWDALQALPDPAQAIKEVGRCLKKGAIFVCFTFRDASDTGNVSEYLHNKRNDGFDDEEEKEGVEGMGGKVYSYYQNSYAVWLRRRQFQMGELGRWLERGGMELVHVFDPGNALFFTAKKK